MARRRGWTLILALVGLMVLPAFRSAKMRLPEALAATEAAAVSGANPRTWNKPLGFGAYRTVSVREGSVFSWSVEVFGVRGGEAKRAYRMVLEGPEAEAWEIECRARAIEAWRKGWSVELTDAFTPRLVCGVSPREERQVLRLVLGSRGRDLRGVVQDARTQSSLFQVRSVHHLEGTRLSTPDPVGYLLEREGSPVAAVETINRGRVWLGPDLDGAARGQVAAAAAALLLYQPDLSPQD